MARNENHKAQIPEPVLKQAQELADREDIPLEQLIGLAVAQSVGIWSNESYIALRARNADREKLLEALKEVPDVDRRITIGCLKATNRRLIND